MKKNSVGIGLAVILAIGVLGNGLLAAAYVRAVRENQSLQFQMAQVNRNLSLLNALGADLLEYSRRDPSIHPILQKSGLLRTAPTNAAPAQPQ